MALKLLPFIVSMVWELLSPAVSKSIDKILQKYLKQINCKEDRDTCLDLIKYAHDSLQMMSGLLVSLIAFVVISFSEIKKDYWEILLIICGILFAMLLVAVLYCVTYDAYKWVAKKWLLWSRGTTSAIILNIILIIIILLLPEMKEAWPQMVCR